MENVKLNDLQEVLEQLRAGFTISRMTFGTLTFVYSLCKKDEKWAKKFTKIQKEYHQFLLDAYKDIEKLYNERVKSGDEEVDNLIDTLHKENNSVE